MEVEILKILQGGGGGVVVCVGLVILFMKHLEKLREDHKTEISGLTDRVFLIAEKTTAALHELREAVVELQARWK